MAHDDRNRMVRRVPLVRPPRSEQGGGAARPFGLSGVPGLPRAGSQRARDLAIQYADDARGRFTERIFSFDLTPNQGGPLVAPQSASAQPVTIEVVSNRSSFVRLVALRGTIQTAVPGPQIDTDPANLKVLISINGEENLSTTGEASATVSYADFFTANAPWFWFAAPPRLRVGDQLSASWFNSNPLGPPVGNSLAGTLYARIVDDKWWRTLYGT